MGLKSSGGYRESLKKLKPNVYINGKRIKNIVDNPFLKPGINTISVTYDLAVDDRYKELMTVQSAEIGETINRFNHIHQTSEDLISKLKMIRECCHRTLCAQRCMGMDCINSLTIVTQQIDKKHKTPYSERFQKFLKYFQENDLVAAVAMTDVKGNRSLRPSEQPDPDMYLHVVEKDDEGIIVKGAKVHTTVAPHAHEIMAIPTRAMNETEGEYSIAFSIPNDTKGLTMICKAGKSFNDEKPELSSRHNTIESLTVFDNVFVPWERVFLCGEHEFSGSLATAFATYHRHSYNACKPAYGDIVIGASALVAEHNGIQDKSHVKEKIARLVYHNQICWACGIAGSVNGTKTESGAYFPDMGLVNIGKLHSGESFHEEFHLLQDIAGGLTVTLPSKEDYENPEIRGYMDKYLKGADNISTRDRINLFRFIKDLTASDFGGLFSVAGIHGGGSPQAQCIEILRQYDIDEKKKIVKDLADIR
ncbi:MAG: 4-hydroxyphenylacetate 3-hydroxylase family protein [Candidatus Altiarchaeota archaeon]